MFNSSIEHAIRIFSFLHDKEKDASVHIHHIVNHFGGSNRTYYEVARMLARAGLLKSSPGSYGGYSVPSKTVTLWDLWKLFNKVEEDDYLPETADVTNQFVNLMETIKVYDIGKETKKVVKKVFKK